MLVRLRAAARSVAATALLAFVAGNGVAALHAHPADSTLVAVKHDASAHVFRAATEQADIHPQYCLACGWSRSKRQRAQAVFVPVPVLDDGVAVYVAVVAPPSFVLATQPPLRAPPTLLQS